MPLYYDNFTLRFNSFLQALEYNSGNEVWLPVPVPTGELGLPNGNVLVGNASNLATPVTLSGAITVSNTGVTTLGATTVHPSNISVTATDDFVFPRDVTATRNLITNGNVTFSGVKNWTWSQNGAGTLILTDVTDSLQFMQVNGGGDFVSFPQSLQLPATTLLDKITSLNSGYVDIETTTVIGANAAPASGAILTVSSTTGGFLPPVMTTTQRNAISSPADGLIVYDATLHLPYEFQNGSWVSLAGASATAWAAYTPTITGVGTASGVQFFWRQIGDQIEVKGYGVTGTVTGASVSYTLPNSTVINYAKIASGSNITSYLGRNIRMYHGTIDPELITDETVVFCDGTTTNLVFMSFESSSNILTKDVGNQMYVSTDAFTCSFSYPV